MVELYDDPIEEQEHDKEEALLNETISKKKVIETLFIFS